MSLTPKTIDHRNPEFIRLLNQRDKDQQIERLHMELASSEGEILASKRSMEYTERRFKHLQIGVSVFALVCFIAIAVEATVIVYLLQ